MNPEIGLGNLSAKDVKGGLPNKEESHMINLSPNLLVKAPLSGSALYFDRPFIFKSHLTPFCGVLRIASIVVHFMTFGGT